MLQVRTLWILCCTSTCWAFCFGLGSQVVTHWLNARDVSDTVIGLNHSFYYLGVALGSFAVPWLNRRLGPIGCATIGMVGSGVTLALFPWGEGIATWYALRWLNGWFSAMSLVPLETIVSHDSPPERRTQNFGFYGVSLTVGGALGIWTGLNIHGTAPTLAFYLGGLVPLLAGLLLFVHLRHLPHGQSGPVSSEPLAWRRNFLSYGTAWCQGFLEGGMLAFLSLFLITRGFSSAEAGTFMSITMLGVILFQVPVSWLADHWGRKTTLLSCYAAVLLTLTLLPLLAHPLSIAIALFCFGACSGAMYPLGLAMLGDRMPASGLARAYAWYLAIECLGSQAGSAIMGTARDRWGETSMFAVGLGAVVLVLFLWLILHGFRSPWTESGLPRSGDSSKDRQAA